MITRGIAAFIGSFTLLNLIGDRFVRRFDSNIWWIDWRPIPEPLARSAMFIAAALLVAYALRPPRPGWRRTWTAAAAGLLALVALLNTATFYVLLARGRIHSTAVIPFSILICAALIAILCRAVRPATRCGVFGRSIIGVAAFIACLILFPLAQTWFFGHTDYRRRADVIVVFGARAYADGTPSGALADRVRTACALYQQGLAPRLIFSGGPGDGKISEPRAMQQMAIELGVDEKAIVLDERGVNTEATVHNTGKSLGRFEIERARRHFPLRLLAVSHGYHLARVKLAYQRAGWEVYTVPARETFKLPSRRFLVCRECAALISYYLRPLSANG